MSCTSGRLRLKRPSMPLSSLACVKGRRHHRYELMPVGQYLGRAIGAMTAFHPFAPRHSYGGPQGLQRLVTPATDKASPSSSISSTTTAAGTREAATDNERMWPYECMMFGASTSVHESLRRTKRYMCPGTREGSPCYGKSAWRSFGVRH